MRLSLLLSHPTNVALLKYMQKGVHFHYTYDYTTKIKSIAIGKKLQFMKKFNFQHQIITLLNRKNKIGTYYVLAAFNRAEIKNTSTRTGKLFSVVEGHHPIMF